MNEEAKKATENKNDGGKDGQPSKNESRTKIYGCWTPPVRVPSPAPEMTLKKNSSAKKAAFEKQTYTNKASNALSSHLTLTC